MKEMQQEVMRQENKWIETLELKNRMLLEKMKEIDDNAVNMQKTLKEAEDTNRKLSEENEKLRTYYAAHLEAITQKDDEIKNVKLKLQTALQINEANSVPIMIRNEKEQRQKFEEAINDLNKQVETLQSELSEKNMKIENDTEKMELLNAQIRDLNKDLKRAKKEKKQALFVSNQKCDIARVENENMQKLLDEKDALISELRAKDDQNTTKIGILKQINRDKNEKIEHFKANFERFTQQLQKNYLQH